MSAELHLGRLLDHVHLRVTDLAASRRFYEAALGALGRELGEGGDDFFYADELFVSGDGEPTRGLHLAFQAEDRTAVERFYEAALAAGGSDNGSPGERTYHPATTPPTCSIRTATTSRRCFTGRRSAPGLAALPR
jgi:catechol 2,3-dioxygenase-like lactoylglutathione lyase family enzyme